MQPQGNQHGASSKYSCCALRQSHRAHIQRKWNGLKKRLHPVLIEVLVTVAKKGHQPKLLSTKGWINEACVSVCVHMCPVCACVYVCVYAYVCVVYLCVWCVSVCTCMSVYVCSMCLCVSVYVVCLYVCDVSCVCVVCVHCSAIGRIQYSHMWQCSWNQRIIYLNKNAHKENSGVFHSYGIKYETFSCRS